jgi:predicted O-methyltransferase YrrM
MKNFDENFLLVSRELEKLSKDLADGKSGIPLWSVPRTTAELLRALVVSSKSKTILELGTSAGYSTLWLARGAVDNNGHVWTVDKESSKIALASKHFKDAGLNDYIIQLSGEISEVLKSWDKKIDFLFIDADKKNYLNYFKTLEKFFHAGTIIVADNVITHASKMKDFLDYIQDNKNYYSTILPLDHGLALIVKF